MLGASGVQLGTRLIATKEAHFHGMYKQNMVTASDTETMIIGRSVGQIRRVLRTAYVLKFKEYEKKGMTLEQYGEMTTEKEHIKGAIEGDLENGFINSGQMAGVIEDMPTVKVLLDRMMEEAKEQINLVGKGIKRLGK